MPNSIMSTAGRTPDALTRGLDGPALGGRRASRRAWHREGCGGVAGRDELLLAGGTLLDPAQGPQVVTNVAFAGGNVAAVGPQLSAADATETVDCAGQI